MNWAGLRSSNRALRERAEICSRGHAPLLHLLLKRGRAAYSLADGLVRRVHALRPEVQARGGGPGDEVNYSSNQDVQIEPSWVQVF